MPRGDRPELRIPQIGHSKQAIDEGDLVTMCSIIGVGRTVALRWLQNLPAPENRLIVLKSVAIEKARTVIPAHPTVTPRLPLCHRFAIGSLATKTSVLYQSSFLGLEMMRARVKAAVRPLVAPLINRFRLVYARIEEVQTQAAEVRGHLLPELRSQLAALRGSNENLTRAWLAQEAELRVQRAAQEAAQQLMSGATQAAGLLKDQVDGIGNRLERESGDLRRQLGGLRSDFDATRTRVDNTLKFILERVEFVRREILFEIQHGGSGTEAGPQSVVSRVVNPERVSAMTVQGLRLNVGCGHIPLDDYVNIDVRDLPGVDIVAEAGAIGLAPGSASEIFSSHLLEHFPEEALKRRILPHWSALLREGGQLRAVVPDGDMMIRQCAAGAYPFADFREVLFGAQDYRGDFHFNLFTPESLSVLLTEAGYRDIAVRVRGRRNGQCFEFEIAATKS